MMPRYLAEQHGSEGNPYLYFLSLKMGTAKKDYMGKRKISIF